MKHLKRVFALMLAMAMLFSALGIAEEAAPEAEVSIEETAPAEQPTKEASKEIQEKAEAEPAEEPVEESAKEPVEEPVEEPAGNPAEEPVEEPDEEFSEEPAEEPAEEPSEEPSADETLEDVENDITSYIVVPDCDHEYTQPYTETKVISRVSKGESGHVKTVQTITATQCVDCGYFTEYDAGTTKVIEEEHIWRTSVDPDDGAERATGECEVCGYLCAHEDARISYVTVKYEDLDAELANVGFVQYEAISDTQHRELIQVKYTFISCDVCGFHDELEYRDGPLGEKIYDDPEDHEYDGNGVCEYCGYVSKCTDGGSHNFIMQSEDAWADSYIYRSATVCEGRGVHTRTLYKCTLCPAVYEEETYDEEATVQKAHMFDNDFDEPDGPPNYCARCGGVFEADCAHERLERVWMGSEDIIISDEPVRDNGNGTHTGKLVVTIVYQCLDCGFMINEEQVVDGTQACEYTWGFDGTVTCEICGAEAPEDEPDSSDPNCKHDGTISDHEEKWGYGVPTADAEGKTHSYEYTWVNSWKACDLCGMQLASMGVVMKETYTAAHNYELGADICSVCGYKTSCKHANLNKTWKWVTAEDSSRYSYKDRDEHYIIYYYALTCKDCGAAVVNSERYKVETEAHVWGSNGVCEKCGVSNETVVDVKQIVLSKTSLTLAVEDTATLTAKLFPTAASNQIVAWLSSNTAVLTVENGVVTPVKAGKATITCVATDGSGVTATCAVTVTGLVKPKLSTVTAESTGIKITWNAVEGAAKYRVYYREGTSGGFTKLADTTSTSYIWTGAKSGKTYSFTVRCLDEDGNVVSSYDSKGLTITYVAAPKLSTVTAQSTGIKITWGAVEGAAKYRVYYREGTSGGFTKLADTASTSYTWTGAKTGKTYGFTVRCLDSKGNVVSSYDPAGLSIAYAETPKLLSVTAESTEIKITWKAVSGAAKYRVYYRIGTTGGFTKLADTTSTSYTWMGGVNGTTYSFTVRCLDEAGKVVSYYNTKGLSIDYTVVPKLSSVSIESTGIKITWEAAKGIAKYRVYYREGTSGGFTKLADTTSTSYTWTGAETGTTYSFTVRYLDEEGKVISSYDSKGLTIAYAATPKLSAVTAESTGIKITWGAVEGAAKYRVFYRVGTSGKFLKLADTASTSYTWTGAETGTTYSFTVRCLDEEGNIISSYDTKGLSIAYASTPELLSVTAESTEIKITWKAVSGAAKYRVYYRIGTTGGFTKLADTASTSYTWMGGVNGTTYSFTVRCLDEAGKVVSYYNTKGLSIDYTVVPKLSSVSIESTGIKITWEEAKGVAKYRVYYREGTSGGFTKLADTTSTSYTWTGAETGTTYSFTVRYLDEEGKVISSYDTKGLSITYKK